MTHNRAEPIQKETPNITAEQRARLKELFPEAFTEGKVDFEKLRATLGDLVDDGPERYRFTWAGKRDGIRLLQTPTRATLVPCREESLNFGETGHIFIEGDNLEVLKLLYKPYFGRVKMIYIDPPYNTGHDFIYPDNYADPLGVYLQLTGQQDAEGNLLTSNPETSGRYHSAWLSMMYPRLFLARQLLREDGVIFVSIDDHEVHNLQMLMNEVFGEENLLTTIVVQSNKRGQTYKQISKTHEYLLVYTKSPDTEINELEKKGERDDLNLTDEIGRFNVRELRNRNPKFGRFNRPNLFYPIYVNPSIMDKDAFCPVAFKKEGEFSIEVLPLNSSGDESCWRWGRRLVRENIGTSTLNSNVVARKKSSGEYGVYEKYRKTTYKAKTIWLEKEVISEKGTVELGKLGLADYFDFPKPSFLVKKMIMLGMGKEDVVIDFFAGSCATAQAVLELNREDGGNRRFIMVQLPEPTSNPEFPTIADIGKERIRRVIARMKQERKGQLPLETRETPEDLGFKVFKLTPSNYRPWRGVDEDTPEAYEQQMALFADPLVDGWTVENVIYEVAIKDRGYELNCRIESLGTVRDPAQPGQPPLRNVVYRITDPDKEQSCILCLADKIPPPLVRLLELDTTDAFVCRDVALDDETAANLALQCRLKTI